MMIATIIFGAYVSILFLEWCRQRDETAPQRRDARRAKLDDRAYLKRTDAKAYWDQIIDRWIGCAVWGAIILFFGYGWVHHIFFSG